MYPLKFKPVFQERIWGGRQLSKYFNKDLPDGNKIGESWEISAHPNGPSIVANGRLKGKTISELVDHFGDDFLGRSFKGLKNFPLLVKLLDAQDKLSVQVHPDDDYAYRFEGRQSGKTEIWYILHAEPGARIVYGFKEGVKKQDILSAIDHGCLDELLNYVPVQKGEVFYIPAGLVHALGAGLLVAEIQQDSDLTYRLYDYNRKDDNGNPRQLHLEKALEVIDFDAGLGINCGINYGLTLKKNLTTTDKHPETVKLESAEKRVLCECQKFCVEKISVSGEYKQVVDGSRFFVIMAITGEGNLYYKNGREQFSLGDTLLVPAGLGDVTITGQCEIILAFVPTHE